MESLVAYKGKRVFITGHTGFKGAWLMTILQQVGASVKGYALDPEYSNGLYDILGLSTDSCIADIRDADRLIHEVQAFQPNFVFHLAAQPLVRRSYEVPAETFAVNVTGTANLLEAVRRLAKPCTVVVVTTDKVYENKESGALYSEDDPLGGYDPYSSSKAAAELVVSSFRNSFFQHAHVATARAGNVIGGGDWSRDRIVPDIVRALKDGRPIEVRNPTSVRPWQHVLEPLSGYLQLGILLKQDPVRFARAYNFGPLPEDHLTVRELVETAREVWGSGSWKDVSNPDAPHEAGLLHLDISRAARELQWEPRWNAREAIRQTLEWYRKPMGAQAAFTLEQIKSYFAL